MTAREAGGGEGQRPNPTPGTSPLPSAPHGRPPGAGEDALVDPERALAVTYAPASARAALTALFALDERLGSIVAATTEPTIGLIRLAWWRESLERLDTALPPAEPLLQLLARAVLPEDVTGASLAAIEDGWAALLDDEPADTIAARHAARGATLFAAAGKLLGTADGRLADAGAGWALADLAHRHSDPRVRQNARERAQSLLDPLFAHAWPKPARPLAALAALARRDAWSAEPRRQGGPGRVARMLALRLTGR